MLREEFFGPGVRRMVNALYLTEEFCDWVKESPNSFICLKNSPTLQPIPPWFTKALGITSKVPAKTIKEVIGAEVLASIQEEAAGDPTQLDKLIMREVMFSLENQGKKLLHWQCPGLGNLTQVLKNHAEFLANFSEADVFKLLTVKGTPLIKRVNKKLYYQYPTDNFEMTKQFRRLSTTQFINGQLFTDYEFKCLFMWYLQLVCGRMSKAAGGGSTRILFRELLRGAVTQDLDLDETSVGGVDIIEGPRKGTSHLFTPDANYGQRGPLAEIAKARQIGFSNLSFNNRQLIFTEATAGNSVDWGLTLIPDEGYIISVVAADDKREKLLNRQKLGNGEGVQVQVHQRTLSGLNFVFNPNNPHAAYHDQLKYASYGGGQVGVWYDDNAVPFDLENPGLKVPLPVTQGFKVRAFMCNLVGDGSGASFSHPSRWAGVDLLNPVVITLEVPTQELTNNLPKERYTYEEDEWLIRGYLKNQTGYEVLIDSVRVAPDIYDGSISNVSVRFFEMITEVRAVKHKAPGCKGSATTDRMTPQGTLRYASIWDTLPDIEFILPQEVCKGSISSVKMWADSCGHAVYMEGDLTAPQRLEYETWFKDSLRTMEVTTNVHKSMAAVYGQEQFKGVFRLEPSPHHPDQLLLHQTVTGLIGDLVMEVEIPLVSKRVTKARITAPHAQVFEGLGIPVLSTPATIRQRINIQRYIHMLNMQHVRATKTEAPPPPAATDYVAQMLASMTDDQLNELTQEDYDAIEEYNATLDAETAGESVEDFLATADVEEEIEPVLTVTT